MFNKRQILDFFIVTILASIVFLTMISKAEVGLWEPWETSTLLAAQQMAHSSIVESSFWAPTVEGVFIAQPCLQLWSLAALMHLYPDPGAFWVRLPSALIGIILVLLTFWAVRQASTRRAAYISAIVLMTLPMFVLSGKLIHGDIWLIFAVSVPNLLFMMACYAETRRMHRAMLSLSGVSLFLSFLSGGFFALAILALEGILTAILLWKHPRRKRIFKPLGTKYFLLPLYVSFVLSMAVFGNFATHYRYALEGRMPVTLDEINRALDEDRVIAIERRQRQIIGMMRVVEKRTASVSQKPFVLVESMENLNTDAGTIFSLNESDKRAFENYLMWRFQKKLPGKASVEVPPAEGSLKAAVYFFWYHSNHARYLPQIVLGKVSSDVISADPEAAVVHSDDELFAPAHVKSALRFAKNAFESQTVTLEPNVLVRILQDNVDGKWTEIQTGDGLRGYVRKDLLQKVEPEQTIQWTSWIDVLLYGLLPWGSFFPIMLICLFISAQKLSLGHVFCGEFNFTEAAQNENRSPLQIMLMSWLFVSVIALFVGMNHNQHDIFTGLIPCAILCGVGLTSTQFWNTIRESLEARLALILTAFICLVLALLALQDEPFRLVRYLLNDPRMHWDTECFGLFEQYFPQVMTYTVIFVIFCIIAFTGIAEMVQMHVISWRMKHKTETRDVRTPSSSSLAKVTRGEYEHMPYAPIITLLGLAVLSSGFIYFIYIPSVSENFTETALIESYFKNAVQSEPVYLVSGENAQLCNTYRDCEPGYVCQDARCQISTFASYSLDVAKPVTRHAMLNALSPESSTEPAFYIIPKDALYEMNQEYRQMYPTPARQNLHVIDAPSSRLYLIGNHIHTSSVNPLDKYIVSKLPEDATPMPIDLDEFITIEGFRLDRRLNQKQLYLTLYYRIKQPLNQQHGFEFAFELANRKLDFTKPVLGNRLDITRLLPGDIIADAMSFELSTIPEHGVFDIALASSQTSVSRAKHHLTTIDY
ncbi:MAG: phospholipid carrier-dependent glycosyltransferase [Proteobacteria bacterium]|nr:phospholipid carrier-dependent glycosyltransferase [Pseudomonadota bacterium]